MGVGGGGEKEGDQLKTIEVLLKCVMKCLYHLPLTGNLHHCVWR